MLFSFMLVSKNYKKNLSVSSNKKVFQKQLVCDSLWVKLDY